MRTSDDRSALLTAIERNKPRLVQLLLEAGAKLNLESENLAIKKAVEKMPQEIQTILQNHEKWLRIREFLKFHQEGEGYPQAMKSMNKNFIKVMVREYM